MAGLFCLCFFILYLFFDDFCPTSYLDVYWTDLLEVCGVGSTVAVADRSDVAMTTKFACAAP